mmetsp:Transcript_10149/g.18279  ORF Transcript_10149/g.18279 Transcript_10149/m.18279 type:complete len:568 (-) Transcript_10149:103-1806(-)
MVTCAAWNLVVIAYCISVYIQVVNALDNSEIIETHSDHDTRLVSSSLHQKDQPISFKRDAYVSVLYNDAYLLPVRVMMRSLLLNSPDVRNRERDRLVLLTKRVGKYARRALLRDGVKIKIVDEIHNPFMNQKLFQKRFASVLIKLEVFGLTQYNQVLYLDGDSLITGDLSPVFEQCNKFCVRYLDPCYFNSGVFLTATSSALYSQMTSELSRVKSYDGSDQGFLNCMFEGVYFSPICGISSQDGILNPEESHHLSGFDYCRLPESYHVDHGSYFSKMRWETESNVCGERKITHYVGPAIGKPWVWLSSSLLSTSHEWNEYRDLVEEPVAIALALRTTFLCLVLIAIALMMWIVYLRVLMKVRNFVVRAGMFRITVEMLIPVIVIAGTISLWCLSGVALLLMPAHPRILHGCALFCCWKFLLGSVSSAFLSLICVSNSRYEDRYLLGRRRMTVRRVLLRTLCFVIAESVVPVVYVFAVNTFTYSSILIKFVVLAIAGFGVYLAIFPFWLGYVALSWISWSARIAFQPSASNFYHSMASPRRKSWSSWNLSLMKLFPVKSRFLLGKRGA